MSQATNPHEPAEEYPHPGFRPPYDTPPPPPPQPPQVGGPYGPQYPQYPQFPQFPPSPAPYVRPVPTEGLAIASLVLGILWVWWVGSILAVIFGHVALRHISRTGKQGRGLAIAGLILGYIGVATLVVFIILLSVGAASNGGS